MNYLNTENAYILFQKALKNEIYVDKSMLIDRISDRIGTNNQYICITRPRRFGKSVNVHMLGAYYTKGQDCDVWFQGLSISKTDGYEEHRNRYNVIFIDLSCMPDNCRCYRDYIDSVIGRLRGDIYEAYPELRDKNYFSVSQMLEESGDSFVFLLDEWDFVFHKDFMSKEDKSAYLDFLKNLLKDKPYVELAYMTGVLPVAKYSSGSEWNMFDEYSFINDNVYDRYFGFSETEVRKLCVEHKTVPYEELAYWYNGYYLSAGERLFNPRSVSKALIRGICLNYWTETGPMNEVADCIEHNTDAVREDIVKMVAGIPVKVRLRGYGAANLSLGNRDEILSAMVVYGFLSYHEGYLQIPNHELMEKYQDVLERKSMGAVKDIVEKSKEMLDATLGGDVKKVASILEEVHDREIPFLQYNDENSLSCVLTLCYLAAWEDYYMEREAKSGKGFCDYLFLPKRREQPAIILELKVDDTCEHALMQIKEKNYAQKAGEYAEEALLVGIAYNRREKRHGCAIEKMKLCIS